MKNRIKNAFEFFNPTTKRYSIINAYIFGLLSEVVYQREAKIQKELRRQKIIFFNNKKFDVQAILLDREDSWILVFRGTESARDWAVNRSFGQVSYCGGKVHSGFKKALDAVWDDIYDHVRKSKKKPFWVTGHSLGGALAILCAERMCRHGVEVHGVYTFGSPRVGNFEYVKYYDDFLRVRSFRFINHEDIVTRLPPRAGSYSHTGLVRYIDDDKRIHHDRYKWRRFIDYVDAVQKRTKDRFNHLLTQYPNGLEKHNIGEYLKAIALNLPDECRSKIRWGKREDREFLEYIHS